MLEVILDLGIKSNERLWDTPTFQQTDKPGRQVDKRV